MGMQVDLKFSRVTAFLKTLDPHLSDHLFQMRCMLQLPVGGVVNLGFVLSGNDDVLLYGMWYGMYGWYVLADRITPGLVDFSNPMVIITFVTYFPQTVSFCF